MISVLFCVHNFALLLPTGGITKNWRFSSDIKATVFLLSQIIVIAVEELFGEKSHEMTLEYTPSSRTFVFRAPLGAAFLVIPDF